MNAKEMYTKEIQRIKTEIEFLYYLSKENAKEKKEIYEKKKNLIALGEELEAESNLKMIERTLERIKYKTPWEE